ncbi:MAG: HlyD family secretion protein [Alphaproteobacteria bacterium]|tara:strand:+ start:189 stop:1343 length:1155 start_codon:yes stop_codon:yes gene_type:complete
MRFKKLTIIFILIIASAFLAIFGLEWWNTNKTIVSTDNAYVRSSITTMSSRVSSYILEVPALTNAVVKKNDLLVILDPEPYQNKVNSLSASLEAAKAKIEASKAKIEAAKTKITTIQSSFNNINANLKLVKSEISSFNFMAQSYSSELELANKNLTRMRKLFNKSSISRAKLDEAIAKVNTTSHKLDSANSKTNSIKNKLEVLATEKEKINSLENELLVEVRKAQAELKISQADFEKSQAELNMAKVDLESTKIYAPIDGVIANRIAEPGLYVEDGWPLMAVVPVHDIWVMANYKETQVENIQVGQKAKLHFDAFKNSPIIGKVHSISPASSASFSLLPPQNASGNFVKVVQRVPVKITFDIPENMLGRIVPGLSVYVSIETKK